MGNANMIKKNSNDIKIKEEYDYLMSVSADAVDDRYLLSKRFKKMLTT